MTNFDMNRYDVKSILESSTLPIGGAAKRLKDMEQVVELNVDNVHRTEQDHSTTIINTSHLTDHHQTINNNNNNNNYGAWHGLSFQQQHHPYNTTTNNNMQLHNYTYGTQTQKLWCKQEQDSDDHHSYDHIHHQLQLGNSNNNSTHNFFQPNSGLQNMMNMDSGSMDNNSSASNSVVYGGDHGNNGYGGSYMIPMVNENEIKGFGYENVFGTSDPYHAHARNLYYQQQLTVDQGGSNSNNNNNWVPTAIPTITPRTTNVSLCPPFTLLHE